MATSARKGLIKKIMGYIYYLPQNKGDFLSPHLFCNPENVV
jgi:hypothetical protein